MVRRRLLARMGLRQAAALAASQPRQARPAGHGAGALRHGGGDALPASPIRAVSSAASAPWAINGCGTRAGRPAAAGVPVQGRPALRRRPRQARRRIRHLRRDRRPPHARLGRAARPEGRHPDPGRRLRCPLGRHRRRLPRRRRGQRGRHLHLHHGDRRAGRPDPGRVRRRAGQRPSASSWASRPDSRPRATSSRRSPGAPGPTSRNSRRVSSTTAPARPACCA